MENYLAINLDCGRQCKLHPHKLSVLMTGTTSQQLQLIIPSQ